MINRLLRAFGMGIVAAALLGSTAPRADAVSDFYKGRTVTVIVGFSAGGTYTLYARLLARHLSQFIPGNPTFVIQNMPGGGAVKSTNYMYNVSPRDGSVIGMPSDAIALTNALTPGRVKYKAADFNYIGAAVRVAYAIRAVQRS